MLVAMCHLSWWLILLSHGRVEGCSLPIKWSKIASTYSELVMVKLLIYCLRDSVKMGDFIILCDTF